MDASHDNKILRESNKALGSLVGELKGEISTLKAQVRQLSEEKYILLRKMCWQRCGTKSKSCPECDVCMKGLLTKNW